MTYVHMETGARVSEFLALRVSALSLAERVIVIEDGKGGKRREVPKGSRIGALCGATRWR